MNDIGERMQRHHKHCDEQFAVAEEAVGDGDWGAAGPAFMALCRNLEAHFDAEERLLFPEFESRTGMAGGPTAVMRTEHDQMRGLMQQMRASLDGRNARAFGGDAETLLILMQQHNIKEENILYPMCDQALQGDAALVARLDQALDAGAGQRDTVQDR